MLPVKPDSCEVLSETPGSLKDGKGAAPAVGCAGESLEGLTLGVSGLAANQSSAVVSVRPHPDVFFQEVLTADSPSFTVPHNALAWQPHCIICGWALSI